MTYILPDLRPQQFSRLLLSSDSDPVQALPTHTVFTYLRTGDLPAEKLYLALVDLLHLFFPFKTLFYTAIKSAEKTIAVAS